MIGVLGDLSLPGAGLAGTLFALLLAHIRVGREDRSEYRAALAATRADYDARIAAEHARVAETETDAAAERARLRARLADAEERAERYRAALWTEREERKP